MNEVSSQATIKGIHTDEFHGLDIERTGAAINREATVQGGHEGKIRISLKKPPPAIIWKHDDKNQPPGHVQVSNFQFTRITCSVHHGC
jgi:hypothetical protein